jgi:hypothetical protein
METQKVWELRTEDTVQKQHYTEDEICDAIVQANGLIMVAARNLKLTRDAIYKRAKSSEKVKEAIKMAREELIDLAESRLRVAVLNGEPWAIQLALKTLGKERGYVERLENTGLDGGAIKTQTILYLPHNERDTFNQDTKELDDGNTVTAETRDI